MDRVLFQIHLSKVLNMGKKLILIYRITLIKYNLEPINLLPAPITLKKNTNSVKQANYSTMRKR